MKTKQAKEEPDKSIDEDTTVEPKTRARKKASEPTAEDEKKQGNQEEPKTSKDPKKNVAKPRAIVKKKPLGIRKALRSKAGVKEKVKNVIKQAVKRGRKPAIKVESEVSQEKEIPLIPASEIKKEPGEETTPTSRSSSPRTANRRQRLSSDMVMMKSALSDSPSTLVIGSRTSPYPSRSDRSNSPSLSPLFDGKNLRSGKPRKAKTALLNEVVMKEQKKRRRLLSDSKAPDHTESSEDCKKLKRGRSCSRDGSEISKCSDITESDLSLNETLNESDNKELIKAFDKPKTDLDIDIENNVQISTTEKVPSLNVDSKLTETKPDVDPSCNINEKNKKKLSLIRSTSLDSDNNNSNRLKLESLNSSDVEDKSLMKTENDTLFEDRSSILTSMSKTFNSKEVSKYIRKARRGRKAATTSTKPSPVVKSDPIVSDAPEDKQETSESLSKEIEDLINNLEQNIDGDIDVTHDPVEKSDLSQTKTVSKFYSVSKPLGDNNSITCPETPIKDKDTLAIITNESTPSKADDSENIRLHYEEDSIDKSTDGSKQDKSFKCVPVASIDKLMDRLKEFEEFDKRRQRQESESRPSDNISVMVSSDVVLIPKSGADIKLKDIQTMKSPERPVERDDFLSCFENNSAISIVKRDQSRKSFDIDYPNSVTLIKRNSISARKESTSSNHSRESDAISIFEKSLGKDVTLTEIRKSIDKPPVPNTPAEIQPFATLHPNNPNQNLVGVVLDSNQISIVPRLVGDTKLNTNEVQITKRSSKDSQSRKSSESGGEEKMATIEKIKPLHQVISSAISIIASPVAVKSPELIQVMETEALAAPLDKISAPDDIALATEVSKAAEAQTPEIQKTPIIAAEITKIENAVEDKINVEPVAKVENPVSNVKTEIQSVELKRSVSEEEVKKPSVSKPVKGSKSARHSIECVPGPSSALLESPESQKRKENVLRTLGLLTHKAANEVKIEKLKEKERIRGLNKNKVAKCGDYTGTLKTVIKLNRGSGEREKKKYRSSLKMTFQKSKNRSGKLVAEPGQESGEGASYCVVGAPDRLLDRREAGASASTDGGQRKSHYSNRLNNHDAEAAPEPVEPKTTLVLVIPEKASSFSIHPERLCQDQCFYCGGKFGLFDTPCHIAQMKSAERQKKVLDNEEKLTIDSCLCDACYRHVDRRANCPSFRKRPVVKPADQQVQAMTDVAQTTAPPPQTPIPAGEDSEEEVAAARVATAACHVAGCIARADRSVRRKWLLKLRPSVNKLLQLRDDYPGLHTIPLCAPHHAALAPLMACALCTQRVTKHHNVHFVHTFEELNPVLSELGLPLQFSSRLVVCKLCRDYCALLLRPGGSAQAQQHTNRLLQIYNVGVQHESGQEPGSIEDNAAKQKKKARNKSKQRKSLDPENPESGSSEKTESSPEKVDQTSSQPLEEDIESLISSNKIPVPGAKQAETQSDSSEPDNPYEFEPALLPVDKQTELQYLLQKQNNPAQFLNIKPNLTQKQRPNKVNLTGIQKPGQQQRIHDKNAKRIQKLGQVFAQKDRICPEEVEMTELEKQKESMAVLRNISLSEECTIETVPNKKPADINTLKNKWQMSDSFTQVKKNLSELSKKYSCDKDPKMNDMKYSNPVKRLETNPSISVRELFPGEEEMNLQCNIEFNTVKGVTPEGWEKCNSLIQYDVETKRLWTELQRPYGNQSSFLRHLILLEKYFRSGDLVLSHNATPHAANYSDSIQSRLRAYDNVASDAPRRNEPAINLIEYRKKPTVNGKSLLKDVDKESRDAKKTMPPPPALAKKPSKSEKIKSRPLPPELIAINTPNSQGRKAITNVLHNIQQLVKGVSASDPTEIAASPVPLTPKLEPTKEKKETPKSDTPKKQKPTSKPWRPTLMPITQENLAKIAGEPGQEAVDGRKLPSLVQVMSSGKRYHITLQDYNKMCIMRREKLQQLQDGESKKKEETTVTEIQASSAFGNGATVTQHEKEDKKEIPELSQIETNAATILKNVGLKNITIAPLPPKTATVTSLSAPAPMITSAPLKLPAVSITAETMLASSLPVITTNMVMPKIPKSLTVIPQTVVPPALMLQQGMLPGLLPAADPRP